jgi:hypothetical protein
LEQSELSLGPERPMLPESIIRVSHVSNAKNARGFSRLWKCNTETKRCRKCPNFLRAAGRPGIRFFGKRDLRKMEKSKRFGRLEEVSIAATLPRRQASRNGRIAIY